MIDQEKIQKQCLSDNREERKKALDKLRDNFSSLPDQQQAWNDLHRLTSDEYTYVRYYAASSFGSVFSQVPDKQKAWNDLHKLTNDEASSVKGNAVYVLGSVFSDVPDKQQAWNDLIKLTSDKDNNVRYLASSALGSVFFHVPDKQKAWNDLIKLTSDKDNNVRSRAVSALGSVFFHVPDKQQAWNDLIKLTSDKDNNVRSRATSTLGSVFSNVPDKQKAWNDLIKLTSDVDSFVKSLAILYALGFAPHYAFDSAFSDVPDKQQAWVDVVKLTIDEDWDVRSRAASALGSVFSQVSDKQQAWNDLIKLASDEDSYVRYRATDALDSVVSYVPDKQKVWNDLHTLTTDKSNSVRSRAAFALGSAFSHIPDKQKAWNDLHRLTSDEDRYVRDSAVSALSCAFFNIPDKQKAWNDLIKLTTDKDWGVRSRAVSALGFVFSQVPDKQQAWNDLIKLANDKDNDVRKYANHSLGKVSIFKASQSENEKDYKKELEKAICFFEKATQESYYQWDNPSQFCLPFYRSFHSIIFKRQEAKEEVNKYLAEAKEAVRGSKSKKLLFEAVNNLTKALKEVQNLENLDLEAKKGELNFYRQYCDRAAELMIEIEETAPFATIAVRKGLPILDRSLKGIIEEIKEKAKAACQVSQGTPTREVACAVNREVQRWGISSQEEMSWYVENLIFTLESTIPRVPENQNFFDRIRQIREEKDIVKQYAIICTIIPLIPRVSMDEKINNIGQGIEDIKKGVEIANENTTIIIEKLDEIQEELKKGFKNLDKLSSKIGGTEGENVKIFSERLLEITKKGDLEVLKRFLEEVLENEDRFIKEIESSSATQKEKEESKGSISKLKFLLKKVKNSAKEFGKDVANEIVVSYTAKGIVEFVLPMMSMAIFGVPIPSQIIDILTNVITEIKNKEFS